MGDDEFNCQTGVSVTTCFPGQVSGRLFGGECNITTLVKHQYTLVKCTDNEHYSMQIIIFWINIRKCIPNIRAQTTLGGELAFH